MENPRAIGEILNQTRKIEENNWENTQYLNSINMMLVSNDLAMIKDKDLSGRFRELHDKVEDVNKLTEELLKDLSSSIIDK